MSASGRFSARYSSVRPRVSCCWLHPSPTYLSFIPSECHRTDERSDDLCLQGAVQWGARLQGATFDDAQLQGAWLDSAQLQGARLDGAVLWRSRSEGTRFDQIISRDITWAPVVQRPFGDRRPWTHEDYLDLQASIGRDVPQGFRRREGLRGIANLDPDRGDWLDYAGTGLTAVRILSATVGSDDYRTALAATLQRVLCEEKDAVLIMHALRESRIYDLASFAPDWVEGLLKGCWWIAGLTDDDRAELRTDAKTAAELAKGTLTMSLCRGGARVADGRATGRAAAKTRPQPAQARW